METKNGGGGVGDAPTMTTRTAAGRRRLVIDDDSDSDASDSDSDCGSGASGASSGSDNGLEADNDTDTDNDAEKDTTSNVVPATTVTTTSTSTTLPLEATPGLVPRSVAAGAEVGTTGSIRAPAGSGDLLGGLAMALDGLGLSPVGVVGTPIPTMILNDRRVAGTPVGASTPDAAASMATPPPPPSAVPPHDSISGNGGGDATDDKEEADGGAAPAGADGSSSRSAFTPALLDSDDDDEGDAESAGSASAALCALEDTASTADGSKNVGQTPAQRRLDNLRRRRRGGRRRTPLRLDDLNYDDEDDDGDDEEKGDDSDDIFQTSYYVRPGTAAKGKESRDSDDAMTRPREPRRLVLVDTSDEEDEDEEASSSSSSSSGITISDDEGGDYQEGKVGGAASSKEDEIDNLFREGLKICSPASPDDDDDDDTDDDDSGDMYSRTTPSSDARAHILSPLEPSPDRVDLTESLDVESVGRSSAATVPTEPADSAWKHDAEADEYYLSSGRGDRGCDGWPNLRLPAQLYQRLYPHQRVGVQWMASLHRGGIGGILGDDMGLGKVCTCMHVYVALLTCCIAFNSSHEFHCAF